MSRHRRIADAPDPGTRAAVVIGLIGLVAVALLGGAWWYLASVPGPAPASSRLAAAASSTADVGSANTAGPTPSSSFVVPTPAFVTPSLTVSLGTLEPEIPADAAAAASGVVAPPAPGVAPAPGQPVQTDVNLACTVKGNNVTATLSFFASRPVPVTLTAASRVESTTSTGRVTMSLNGGAGNAAPTCSASINGVKYGPIAAR